MTTARNKGLTAINLAVSYKIQKREAYYSFVVVRGKKKTVAIYRVIFERGLIERHPETILK